MVLKKTDKILALIELTFPGEHQTIRKVKLSETAWLIDIYSKEGKYREKGEGVSSGRGGPFPHVKTVC